MADDEELNQKEHKVPLVEELERLETKVFELEEVVALKERELASRAELVSKLEQAAAKSDSEIAGLKQSMTESADNLNRLSDSLAQAVSSYQGLVVGANPEVPEELITGDTISSINDSLTQAKALVGKVRQGLEVEIMSAKVPAGAPMRTAPDLSGLSPREKIKYAIGGSP